MKEAANVLHGDFNASAPSPQVPGDTFYHLIDIRDGVYHPDGDEGRERVRRLLHGLRIDKKGMQMDALALEEEEVGPLSCAIT
jgi:hypothetical protein